MSMNKIKCRICENEYNIKQFGMHISRTHQMEYVEYAKQYWKDLPNWSPCKNEGCDEICKDTYCSRKCFKEGHSVVLTGRKLPPWPKERKQKLSKNAKARFFNSENHPMYGKTHSEETINKISNTKKEWYADPENDHPLLGKPRSEETKKKISDANKLYYTTHDSFFKGRTHTPETIKKIFQNKPMNKLEARVAEYLDSLGIYYHFQFFINDDGVCKSYDFKIKNSDIILEIHGDYWHGGEGIDKHVFNVDKNIENDKLKKEIAKNRGYEIIVIWESEFNEDESVIKNKIQHNLIF